MKREPERINSQLMQDWSIYPNANYSLKCKTQGKYSPVGAVVHYTAGKRGNPQSIIAWANLVDAKQNKTAPYTFHLIESDGTFYQTHPLNEWGYHAGISEYQGLGKSLSNKLIGIEIACAGLLTDVVVVDRTVKDWPLGVCEVRAKAWFDKTPQKYFARYNNGKYGPDIGWYEAFTLAQEHALVDFLIWCKNSIPTFKVEYILGHHEISPKRKQDPEAALSITMHELRELIRHA